MYRLLVIGGRVASSRRAIMRAIVPTGSRGMKDPDPRVRAETARAMLAVRYATTPTVMRECAYPPCRETFMAYDRGGKRKTYCSPAHTTAMCRLRARQAGIPRRPNRKKVARETSPPGG
jgi:hypothetical protein